MAAAKRPNGRRKRRAPKSREREQQQKYIKWCRKNSMHHAAFIATYSTPNAGKRSVRQAMILRTEGMLKGIPDTCFPTPSHDGKYGALYLEFKAPPDPVTGKGAGRLSPEQKIVIAELREAGNRVEVVDCAVRASDITVDHLGLSVVEPLTLREAA